LTKIVAIAGKGGTGKTTVSGLLIRCLQKSGRTPVLAVDADPDANLAGALGMTAEKTIGGAREDFFQSKGDIPAGIPKEAYLDVKLHETVVEGKDTDLLVMGRPEGAGCYCYINNSLRKYLEVLAKNYPYVIIDNEAGLEHLSRRTTQDVDVLLVVSDYSANGVRAAKRIAELADELQLRVGARYLIINGAPEELAPHFAEEVKRAGIPVAGIVPVDEMLPQYEREEKPLTLVPDSSPAVQSIQQIAEKIFQR
jgi:CO dehydrogenase maturation factor